MREGSRKTQLTTETRRADERRSIREAGSAQTSTSAGNKKAAPKTRATNQSGTRTRTRPGAERKTERDATKGTNTKRETESETTSLTESQKERKTSKKTEAKRKRESITRKKRGLSLGTGATVRFVIVID